MTIFCHPPLSVMFLPSLAQVGAKLSFTKAHFSAQIS